MSTSGVPRFRCSPGRSSGAWAGARGVTLLEVMVVMVLLGLIMGGVIMGTGQLGTARVKRAATMVAGAVRVGFTRATATSKPQRIVFDMDESKIWLEEASQPMLVQSKDTTGTGGAEAATAAERQAITDSESILKGPRMPRAQFKAVESLGFAEGTGAKGPRPLGRGIKFREIQTGHDDQSRTTGRAYLYFWPGGQTERASVQLRIGDSMDERDALTLLVSPLTGKVTVKPGALPLVIPTDDKEASEREDKGGF
jgi:general secretion pathway protein H